MDNLEDKTRVELMDIAKSLGVKSVTIMRKDQLKERIQEKLGGAQPNLFAEKPVSLPETPAADSASSSSPKQRRRGRPRLVQVVVDQDEPIELSKEDLIPIPEKTVRAKAEHADEETQRTARVSQHDGGRAKYFKKPVQDDAVTDQEQRAKFRESRNWKQNAGNNPQQQGNNPQQQGESQPRRQQDNRQAHQPKRQEPQPQRNEGGQRNHNDGGRQQQHPNQNRNSNNPHSGKQRIPNQQGNPQQGNQQRNPRQQQQSQPKQQQPQHQEQRQRNQPQKPVRELPGSPKPVFGTADPYRLTLHPSHGDVRFNPDRGVPASNAPTLKERIEDITPYLAGFLLNEGTLEIMPDGAGFLRSIHYGFMPGPDDVFVPAAAIKHYRLRQGDCIIAIFRPPMVDEQFFMLMDVVAINGRLPEEIGDRTDFEDLLPVYPDERFKLETTPQNYSTRIIDLFAPLGKGQRGLIVAQPKTGKTNILRNIANAVSENNPETRIIILLVDERPEEVTDMERSVIDAEVVASTFDMRPENHVRLAELVFAKARRLVECGQDVLILMDSITRLARAYNICANNTGRTMSGGIDAQALKVPRQLFSSARNIEGGGSLTIIATALIDTGSRMDDVIFEEFKGTGNMEIVLDRRLADRRIFPAIDVFKSGTRREELLVSDEEREKVVLLRRYLTTMTPIEAVEFLLDKMKGTYDNRHFLISMNQ